MWQITKINHKGNWKKKKSCCHGNITVKNFSCSFKASNFDNQVEFPAPHSKLLGETSAGMSL